MSGLGSRERRPEGLDLGDPLIGEGRPVGTVAVLAR